MKFLFYAPQMAAYGGMERHICTLAEAAAKKGHHIRVLTTSNSLGEDLRSLLSNPLIELSELPSPRLRSSGARRAFWLAKSVIRARCTSWDSIYTNGQSGFASWVWRARNAKSHIIHHHHTASDHKEQESWSPAFRHILTTAPTLVGCSQATCRNIEGAITRTRPPLFLPYLTRCVMNASDISEPAPKKLLHLGFLGRLVREKGIDLILALSLAPELANIHWHIHGEGPDFPPSCFTPYPNIHYHGAYRNAAKHREIMASLDAVILPSRHNEGMPLSLIEAMSAGLPWIATDRGGTSELARSPEDCLILSADEQMPSITSRIREFADKLQAGRCSHLRQRAAYDCFLAPDRVSAAWLTLLESRPNAT